MPKRIEGIKKLANQHWQIYCPSALKPAYLLSRGVAVGVLVDECSIWGRILIGFVSLRKSGLFGASPAFMWNMRYTRKAWKLLASLQGNKFKPA